jgi:hypothetical protein
MMYPGLVLQGMEIPQQYRKPCTSKKKDGGHLKELPESWKDADPSTAPIPVQELISSCTNEAYAEKDKRPIDSTDVGEPIRISGSKSESPQIFLR